MRPRPASSKHLMNRLCSRARSTQPEESCYPSRGQSTKTASSNRSVSPRPPLTLSSANTPSGFSILWISSFRRTAASMWSCLTTTVTSWRSLSSESFVFFLYLTSPPVLTHGTSNQYSCSTERPSISESFLSMLPAASAKKPLTSVLQRVPWLYLQKCVLPQIWNVTGMGAG